MGSVVRGLTTLVLALPLLVILPSTPASPTGPAFSEPFPEIAGTAPGNDITAPVWITLVSATRLLSAPVTESSGSGVEDADGFAGTPGGPSGPGALGRPSAGPVLPSMETRAGLISHRATAPPPEFLA